MTKRSVRLGIRILGCGIVVILLGGCWDKNELTQWGFVQAVAIDQTDQGEYRVTTQIYRPGSSESRNNKATKGISYLTISSEASTISQAAAHISGKLGRKLQWSHMRALLISEKMAANRNIGNILDYFSRSQGPRGAVAVMTTDGEAGNYLLVDPLIENTIGQQMKTVEGMSNRLTGMASKVSILDLDILAQSPSSVTLLPHLRMLRQEHPLFIIDGMNLLRFPSGTIDQGFIPAAITDSILMVRDEFNEGLATIPCEKENEKQQMLNGGDSYWIYKEQTTLQVSSIEDRPFIEIHLEVDGKVGEMSCSSILTKEEHRRFINRIEQTIKKDTMEAVQKVQKMKADILLVGQHVQRRDPRLWKRWSEDWDDRFSQAKVSVKVKARLTDTGMNAGSPMAIPPE
ncbi:Ger(x)C family spore germination protein [Paenibacillus qinlingensis]|uniref:Ger(x)C family spore germination protein n=1 Tax=Paenibacillus qinlingensis TaxID=1837343 RepID=UPI00156338ED|nr:Ger(x)C family spore germination protein [Paenibacillus qinlingensis]NQX59664.1 Ger(x)C family spore germination protein [Paenibacillus qinlingensis]